MDMLTLDTFPLKGKRVLVRIDINCPLDPETKKVSNDERIRLHSITTIKELRDAGARTVLLSHQGRPGDAEFVSLEGHVPFLEKYLGCRLKFVDDVFGSAAQSAIDALQDGDVLLLENVRFFAEEMFERPADVHAKSVMIQKLVPHLDLFVNDAFATIHRSQASLVGFGEVLPTIAGRVMESELKAIDAVLNTNEHPVVYVLGGVKVKESLKVIKNLLESKRADTILTGGLLGNLFLSAKGYHVGQISWEVMKGKNIDQLLPQAKHLVEQFPDKIETPVDVAVNKDGRKEMPVSLLPTTHMILDVGGDTVKRYSTFIENAKIIVLNSPFGRFETPGFGFGTQELLKKVAASQAFTVVGGGHSAKIVADLGISKEFNHVSIGGRATLYHLSGEPTPVVSMLKKAYLKHTENG